MRHRPRRNPSPGAALRALMLGALATFGIAAAQQAPLDVSDVLPATTIAAFYAAPTSAGWGALQDVLDEIDVAGAMETLARFTGDAADVSMTPDGLAGAPSFAFLLDELVDDIDLECPPLADVLRSDGLEGLLGPSVVAVSVSPFSPLPGAIAVARPADATLAAAFQDALVACAGSGLTLQEGDVGLHVVGDGSDLPLVLAMVDGLFLAATDPELARAAVRLARGSTEPRFVDGPIGFEARALMGEGLGVALDLAALADALEGLRGFVPAGDEAGPLIDRLFVGLRTIGGFAARVTIDGDGVLIDSAVTVDETAGDVELARLLACEECRPGTSRLVPSGVVSLQGRVFSPHVLVDWIDGWLDAVGALIGEPIDLRSLAQEFAGIDLDTALLDWVGTTWNTAQLAPLGTDLRGWVTGPGTIVTVPVSSEEAARDGIATWKDAVSGLPMRIGSPMGGGGPIASLLGFVGDDGGDTGLISVRDVEYRGVPYERWRVGPTVDVAIAVIDAHLVVAIPSASMRAAIDVHQGAAGVQDDPVLREALAGLPAEATAYDVADVTRTLRSFASLADFIAAPAASSLMLVIAERDERWDDDVDWEMEWYTEPGGITGLDRSPDRFGNDPRTEATPADTLAVPASVTREITSGDLLSDGALGHVFDLVGLQPGDLVQIEMLDPTASDVDTYLYLFDVGAGRVIADNDDAPGWDRSEIVFEVDPTVRYAVVATSWGGSSTGAFVLNTQVLASAAATDEADAAPDPEPGIEPEAVSPHDDAEPLVTFDEVVALFDVLTAFLEGLADRSGVAVGSTETVDGVSRSTLRIPLR